MTTRSTVAAIALSILAASEAGGFATLVTATPMQTPDPCALLTTADVQGAFPGSKAGQLDRRQEKSGLVTCIWYYPTGRFSVIASTGSPEPVKDEARNWTLIFLDPLRPALNGTFATKRCPASATKRSPSSSARTRVKGSTRTARSWSCAAANARSRRCRRTWRPENARTP